MAPNASIALLAAVAGCAWGDVRARAVIHRNEPLRQLSIRVLGLANDAELEVHGRHISVRLSGAHPLAEIADPDRWDVFLSSGCGIAFGPTGRRAIHRGLAPPAHVAEAVYDFDWPDLADARRLTLVVRRPDVELRYTWRFTD